MGSRDHLDALLRAAHAAQDALNAQDWLVDRGAWRAALEAAKSAWAAVSSERSRLWGMAPWGAWMTPHDRELARISLRL